MIEISTESLRRMTEHRATLSVAHDGTLYCANVEALLLSNGLESVHVLVDAKAVPSLCMDDNLKRP